MQDTYMHSASNCQVPARISRRLAGLLSAAVRGEGDGGGSAARHRGDRGAYERYLRGMDASMRQKVALTAAHLLGVGRVADLGMGSGTGTQALAALYPRLDVVGVDLDP